MCPYEANIAAMAYYQTNPDTKGAISVTKLDEPGRIHHVVPV